ncbi:MAG: RNA pyrophosphohydrolase [Alphaproteobacteria bacterium]|nr:RNA pyrophosphohydrolase [Alphaproteobacteria bacterium]
MARTDLPYRKGVGIMLFNAQGLVFVAKRIDMTSEAWQMPQGGIDDDEAPRDAAFRELKEEIGTNRATILAESKDWLRYDLPDELVPVIWKGRYRGQEQMWYAMRLDGDDSHIDIAGEHPEFSEWKWVPVETLPDLIVPFKRALYEDLVREFKALATPI